jgi:hypothetical protein
MLVRSANQQELDQLNSIDEIPKTSSDRRAFIQRSVDEEVCWVITTPGGKVIGYGVLDYSSTNLSNRSMQALLEKRKYILSGVLHHLDEEDPELVYVKYLN